MSFLHVWGKSVAIRGMAVTSHPHLLAESKTVTIKHIALRVDVHTYNHTIWGAEAMYSQ